MGGPTKAMLRIQKELSVLKHNKIDDVTVTEDKYDPCIWYFDIKGPINSPYEGGTFHYKFIFPKDYPFKPPECILENGIYHPDYSGYTYSKVCLKCVQDGWSPSISMRYVILQVKSTLAKPDGTNPNINPDAYNNYKNNREKFYQIAKEWTGIYAMKFKWTKEKELKMLKESKEKNLYITKTYKSVNKFETKEVKLQLKKDQEFTKKILSKKCSGTTSKRDTLLRVIHAWAKSQNKECLFSTDKKNKNSKFITGMGDNKQQKAVLVLDNLEGLISQKKSNNDDIEQKVDYNDSNTLKKQICELQDALKYKKRNETIDTIKDKIARSHGIDVKYVQINDITYGSAHVDYEILVSLPNKGALTDAMRQEFSGFRDLQLHPLFYAFNFNIEDFDERGNKTFGNGTTFQIGPPDRKKTYTQPSGWTRFGLKVLDGRYEGNDEWLHPFKHDNNWYRAYHGTKWSLGESIVHGNAPNDEPSPVNNQHAYFVPGGGQAHRMHEAQGGGLVGKGIYCSDSPDISNSYCGTAEIQTTEGPKKYLFMFQVCVDPDRVKVCRSHPHFWVVPDDALHDAMRPYGILLKEVTPRTGVCQIM